MIYVIKKIKMEKIDLNLKFNSKRRNKK